jgi:hypothetical protein
MDHFVGNNIRTDIYGANRFRGALNVVIPSTLLMGFALASISLLAIKILPEIFFRTPWLSCRRCRRHVASADSDSRKLDIWQKYVSVDAARSDHQAAHGIADFAGLTKCTF